MTDLISLVLNCVPVPGLSTAFNAFSFIVKTVHEVQASQQQLHVLTHTIAQLLQALHREFSAHRLDANRSGSALKNLDRLMYEISIFVQAENTRAFLRLLFTKNERVGRIDGFHRKLANTATAFQITALVDIVDWQNRNDKAREADQTILQAKLDELQLNQNRLANTLESRQNNMMAMMVSIKRHLDQRDGADGSDMEHRFFSHSLTYLQTQSGRMVEMEDWMITAYEVDIGPQIGSGGHGRVHKGTWNKTLVAIKVLKTEGAEVSLSTAMIRNEVKMWSQIRHPNVLQFLGANVLDDRPFIVMPYLRNGNARDFVLTHPDFDKVQLFCDVSLGLFHLHTHKIVHGDVKALNILIDDAQKAVLCDFGLSKIKAEVTVRLPKGERLEHDFVDGSRNWMAPERLLGGSLRPSCDVYSLGMTIFELFANEIPLGSLTYSDFTDLVAIKHVRPEQPSESEAPGFTEEVWQIAVACWQRQAKDRPTADQVHELFQNLTAKEQFSDTLTVPVPFGEFVQPSTATSSTGSELSSLFGPNPFRASPAQNTAPLTLAPDHPLPGPSNPKSTSPSHSPVSPSPTKSKFSIPWVSKKPPPMTLIGHLDYVYAVGFAPNNRLVVSGSRDQTCRVWDVRLGSVYSVLQSTSVVSSAAFSPDSRLIATGSLDGRLHIWEVGVSTVAHGPFNHSADIFSVAFSPDGKQLAVASGTSIYLRDAKEWTMSCEPLTGHRSYVLSVAFHPTGKVIASASDDNTIRLWNALTGVCLRTLSAHTDRVWNVSFSNNGHRMLSASRDGTVRVWNVGQGAVVAVFREKKGQADCACFSQDSRWVASSGGGHEIHIWDANTGEKAHDALKGHKERVTSLAFSSATANNQSQLVSGSYDGTVRVWNIEFQPSVQDMLAEVMTKMERRESMHLAL